MPRNIKFRVWDKDNKKMLGYDEIKCKSIKEYDYTVLLEDFFMTEAPWEFMQFTGLYDSAGKEIYEGDLLRFVDRDSVNFADYEVFFHDGDEAHSHIGFQINRIHYKGGLCGGTVPNFLPCKATDMEVSGNIYENPNLLTK